MPNGFVGVTNNGTIPTATLPALPATHPAVLSGPGGYCSGMLPRVCFPGIFPYGMSGSFQTSYPNNRNFSYNNDVNYNPIASH